MEGEEETGEDLVGETVAGDKEAKVGGKEEGEEVGTKIQYRKNRDE